MHQTRYAQLPTLILDFYHQIQVCGTWQWNNKITWSCIELQPILLSFTWGFSPNMKFTSSHSKIVSLAKMGPQAFITWGEKGGQLSHPVTFFSYLPTQVPRLCIYLLTYLFCFSFIKRIFFQPKFLVFYFLAPEGDKLGSMDITKDPSSQTSESGVK